MPQAAIEAIYDWVATALAETGLGYAAIDAIATVVAYAVVLAPLYLYNAAQARKANAANNAGALAGRTLTFKQPAATRQIIYGKVRIGGLLTYIGSSGATNEFLHVVVTHAGHECQSIDTLYFNEDIVTLDGSGNATGKYAGFAKAFFHLGGAGQVVDPTLTAAMPEWDSTCVGNNITYTYIQLKTSPDLYSGGMPNFSVILKGKKLYDPRDGTTVYKNNLALELRDYLTDLQVGLGATAAEIDDAECIAAANHCDEAVALAAGGTEPRYAGNGTVDTATAPGSVIQDLCAGMAGSCPYIGGQFKIRAGVYIAATGPDITDDDLANTPQFGLGDSMATSFNGCKGTFVSPDTNWQPADIPPYINNTAATSLVAGKPYMIVTPGTTTWTAIGAANNNAGTVFIATGAGTGTGGADKYAGEDQGQRVWNDVTLPFTTSVSTARRLLKIALEHNRRDKTINFPGKLTLLDTQVGDTKTYTSAKYGWGSKTFSVLNCNFSCDKATGRVGMNLVLRETDSTVFNWSTTEEQSLPTTNVPTVPNYYSLSTTTPATPTATQVNAIQGDGSVVPRVQLDWTASGDAAVTNGGYTDIEYKKTADSAWLVWGSPRGDLIQDFITDVTTGVSYDFRVRYENAKGVRSLYSAVETISITVASVATPSLSPPGELFTTSVTVTATCATGGATIRYTIDGSAPNSSSPAFPGGGLALTSSTTLRVKAFNGTDVSAEVSQAYTLSGGGSTVATPSINFSPASYTGFFSSTCSLSCATAGASIRKRINGGAWSVYSGAFTVGANDLVEAQGQLGGSTDSYIASSRFVR